MGERTLIISQPGAPGSAIAESVREWAWSEFVVGKREPAVAPVVRDSWLRSRDVFHVDPALKRSPIVLPEDEWCQRRERLEALGVGVPVLERFGEELRETQDMLALCDADGYVLATGGHPRVIEETTEINLRVGGSWSEQSAGTNGIGTALAEGRTVQVIGAEHYVAAWQRWVCTGAPIRHPITGETLAVIDVTGYKERVQAHTLLAVQATAALIEQRLLLEFTLDEKLLCDRLFARANRMPADAMLAVDHRGRVVQLNAAAERLLTARHLSGGQTLRDELRLVVEAALERGGGHPEGYEQTIGSRALGCQVRTVTLPVFRDRRPIGAIVVLPLGDPGRLADRGRRMRAENLALREEVDQASMFEEIVGTSAPLRAVLARVSRVAPTDSTVLITGETGTGKERVARAIHKGSARSSHPFVSVNCAAIPQALIASELFGHEKGAFTGALERRLGRFELADGGTIFLDEVGDLPSDTQLALLRVLQERELERVGGNRSIRVDVRVIAATNRDLNAAMAAGGFRSDLFYRLNVFPIEMPPLRERQEDIPLLAAYFVHRYAMKAAKTIGNIDERTLEILQHYSWPGNIRELQNVIERSVIICETETFAIDESWLRRELPKPPRPVQSLADDLASREREVIETALAASQGRVSGPSGAAAKLGIPGSTLDSKIRALGIRKERFKGA
jgi:transcriptional regulator of acetoin/glycerol metabolism